MTLGNGTSLWSPPLCSSEPAHTHTQSKHIIKMVYLGGTVIFFTVQVHVAQLIKHSV